MMTINDFARQRPRTVLNEYEVLIKALECAKPLRFAVAASSSEREAVYQLRYQVVTERAWGNRRIFQTVWNRMDTTADQCTLWGGMGSTCGLDENRASSARMPASCRGGI